MYKYEVEFKYNLGTGPHPGSTSKKVEITFPKRVYAFTDAYGDDGKGKNEILTKAVNDLGLDPNMVEAIADRNKLDGGWYKLRYLGEEGDSKTKKVEKSKSEKSIFEPLWAFPFKLIWRLIKGILFFWVK
jgi:hypothetical protein